MQVVKMSDRWLRAVSVSKGREEFGDAVFRGLRLRVSAKSKKWSVVTRDNGKLIRRPLGAYPDMGILRAREAAEDIIDRYNPLKAEKIRLEDMPMIDELCRDYVAKMKANGQVSYGSYERNLLTGEFSFYSYLSTLPDHPFKAADISKSHVTEWLRQTNLRSPAHVRHCRSYLHAVFNWGLKADFDYTASPNKKSYGLIENPVAATPSSAGSKPRDRVLTKAEIKQYWEALPDYTSARTCSAIRMIISMGGLRVSEISRSKKAWYVDGWLRLPETKNGKEHFIPLTSQAKEQYQIGLACSSPRSEFLFNNRDNVEKPTSLTTLSKITRDLVAGEKMEPFQLKDLRRTYKTILLDKGLVGEREIDIWHNHGQNSDVARKHYTWAEFRDIKLCVAKVIEGFLTETIK